MKILAVFAMAFLSLLAICQTGTETLGSKIDKELTKDVIFSSNQAELKRLSDMGGRIVQATEREDLVYAFKIVEDDSINAFTFGDGHIYITRGLYDKIENDNQLAALLAHEIAHNVNDDIQKSFEALKKAKKRNTFWDALIGAVATGEITFPLKGGIVTASAYTRFSRAQEEAADDYMATMVEKAGFNPLGTIGLMSLLNDCEASSDKPLLGFLASHPPTQKRMDKLVKKFLTPVKDKLTQFYPKYTCVKVLYSCQSDESTDKTKLFDQLKQFISDKQKCKITVEKQETDVHIKPNTSELTFRIKIVLSKNRFSENCTSVLLSIVDSCEEDRMLRSDYVIGTDPTQALVSTSEYIDEIIHRTIGKPRYSIIVRSTYVSQQNKHLYRLLWLDGKGNNNIGQKMLVWRDGDIVANLYIDDSGSIQPSSFTCKIGDVLIAIP